jgi:hypothetical protein
MGFLLLANLKDSARQSYRQKTPFDFWYVEERKITSREMSNASIVSRAEPDASAFRLISRRALAHGFQPILRSVPSVTHCSPRPSSARRLRFVFNRFFNVAASKSRCCYFCVLGELWGSLFAALAVGTEHFSTTIWYGASS